MTVLSEDRKGLVSILTGMLNRKGIEIESVGAARTDVHSRVLITLEVIAEAGEVKNVSNKIGNIIEVNQVDSSLMQDAWYQKVG